MRIMFISSFLSSSWKKIANGRVTLRIPGQLWNRLVGLGALTSWGGEDFFNPKTEEQRSKEMSDNINEFIEVFGKHE